MPEWKDIISVLFVAAGVAFMITSTIGIIRFPDFYIRLSTVSKAVTLGLTLILIGIGIHFNSLEVTGKIIMIFFFLVITAPVSAHIIGRAAAKKKVPFWSKTQLNKGGKEFLRREQIEEDEDK